MPKSMSFTRAFIADHISTSVSNLFDGASSHYPQCDICNLQCKSVHVPAFTFMRRLETYRFSLGDYMFHPVGSTCEKSFKLRLHTFNDCVIARFISSTQ